MCRFYSMSYREVLDMPLRAFWSLNRNISRIRAEEDMRTIQVMGALQSGEIYQTTMAQLQEEHDRPMVIIDNRRTENATAALKEALMG